MRILWWSNAPWAATGYGVQTRLFVTRMIRSGHDVAICTVHGLQAGPIEWNGIQVFPALSGIGNASVSAHSETWHADITISLFDAWAAEPLAFSNSAMRWVPWFPVDMEPLPRAVREKVQEAFCPIVFSRFGEQMSHKAGLTPLYVPHGVDEHMYRPTSRQEAREALGCPADCFLLGFIGANKDYPSRKAIPQILEAFARFAARRKDAYLYLHTTCNDAPYAVGGVNVAELIDYFGLGSRVVTADGYNVTIGYSDEYMVHVYNAIDGLVSPSLGEGFGVPILEAQACGSPVLVGDWSSMTELCFAGYKIPRERSEPFWSQLGGFFRIPHVAAIEEGMDALYAIRGDRNVRESARQLATAYGADRVFEQYWQPALDTIAGRLSNQRAINRKAALLLDLLDQAPRGPVVEVGCVRRPMEVKSDGYSTVYLARACAQRDVPFAAFDLDPLAVDVANRALRKEGLEACVACSDGAAALGKAAPIAFLYLDSSDDPKDTLNQFMAAALLPGAIVVVDDVQGTNKRAFGKATELMACVPGECVLQIVPTELGYASLVLRVRDGKRHGLLPKQAREILTRA